MPQKRRPGKARSGSDDDNVPKRRRVSLACDACRAAREKCDGTKPQCGACTALSRPCVYTPAKKKRGVQSGYLRTIELSLAWLIHQMPEAEESLHHVLTQSSINPDTRSILGRGSSGRRLQDIWNQARVRTAIETLLSTTATDDESNTEVTHEGTNAGEASQRLHAIGAHKHFKTHESVPDSASDITLHLPADWKRLLDAYISDTHCWLPVVRPESLYSLAESYRANGVSIKRQDSRFQISQHAELWAALAIGSFQGGDSGAELPAPHMFQVARSLLPEDDTTYDIHNVNAMLLHSLVFIGRGKTFTASLLLGKIGRILNQLQLPSVPPSTRTRHLDATSTQMDIARISCAVLDRLTIFSFGQRGITHVDNSTRESATRLAEGSGFGQAGQSEPTSSDRAIQLTEPVRVLLQLHAFTSVLNDAVTEQLDGQMQSTIGPEHLVSQLDPHFHFCNSLIPGTSPPMTNPSTVLVKLVFLTASMELAPHLRPSLYPGFLETVQSCVTTFGTTRTPPLVPLLFQILQKNDRGGVSDGTKGTWSMEVEKLRNVWDDVSANQPIEGRASNIRTNDSRNIHQRTQDAVERTQPVGWQAFDSRTENPPASNDSRVANVTRRDDVPPTFANRSSVQNAGQLYNNPFDLPTAGRPSFSDDSQSNRQPDYDALLDSIGSIDYGYNTGMDRQFMTNLGFAPDCDLAEMFQSDYGL